MSIKLPAVPLPSSPRVKVLKKGKLLHRIHGSSFAFDSFNPCQGGKTRFAPIHDVGGACIPSMYAASTLEAAIHETIFHDIPNNSKFRSVPTKNIVNRTHSRIKLMNNITMAVLTNASLGALGISRRDLIESGQKLYAQTAKWAEEIHNQFPHIDGLMWTSRQCDPDLAYLLFGDRVKSSDFRVVQQRDGSSDKTLMKDVKDEARIRGIKVTL